MAPLLLRPTIIIRYWQSTVRVQLKFRQCCGLLSDALLTADQIEDFVFCKDSCNLCLKSCPANALDGTTVVQKKCRPNSSTKNKKGYELYTCNMCRKVCPYRAGINNREVEKPLSLKRLVVAKNFM